MTAPTHIHPLAVVDPAARLGAGVTVGPFCVVGPAVHLGDGVTLVSNVVVAGQTTVGARTRIFPFASIGHEPQDLKFKGEPSTLTIGEDCLIREGVTMNPGTASRWNAVTTGRSIAARSSPTPTWPTIATSAANVVFSNNVMLAGHCQVGDFVILGGGAACHQFVRIGAHAFVGGLAGVENDVIPYGMALGNRAHLAGLNLVGLKRRGFSREQIHEFRRAYRLIFAAEGTLKERLEDVGTEFVAHTEVQEILTFIRGGGERAVCVPREVKDGLA